MSCPGLPVNTRLLCSCQVIPGGEHRTIYISFTPTVLGPGVMHKVGYTGYALGFMSLDKEVSLPTWAEGTMATFSPLGAPLPAPPGGPAVTSDGLGPADRQTDSRPNATPSGLCREPPETGSEWPRETRSVSSWDLPPLPLSSLREDTYFPGVVLRAKGQVQKGGRDNRQREGVLLGPDPGVLSSTCHWTGCTSSWTAAATWNSGARPATSSPKIPVVG